MLIGYLFFLLLFNVSKVFIFGFYILVVAKSIAVEDETDLFLRIV